MVEVWSGSRNWQERRVCGGCSIFMGSVPHPTQSNIKVPVSHYEFGANLMDPMVRVLTVSSFTSLYSLPHIPELLTCTHHLPQMLEMWSLLYDIVLCNAQGKTQMVMLIGRILTDGRMSARIKYDVNDRFSFKINAQVCFSICGHQCSPSDSPSVTDSRTIQCSCQAAYHYPLWPL